MKKEKKAFRFPLRMFPSLNAKLERAMEIEEEYNKTKAIEKGIRLYVADVMYREKKGKFNV